MIFTILKWEKVKEYYLLTCKFIVLSISLHISDVFHATMAEWSSCNRDNLSHKTNYLFSGVYGKCLLTFDLGHYFRYA